ncbi:MAG: hypothetical protein H6831_14585 [Planctomycetes bacterium]|nr:hypothetical protein [Planctomycetota bacterium]MCB9905630.1 hypothetical protein [Planctomycetota bacterium]
MALDQDRHAQRSRVSTRFEGLELVELQRAACAELRLKVQVQAAKMACQLAELEFCAAE